MTSDWLRGWWLRPPGLWCCCSSSECLLPPCWKHLWLEVGGGCTRSRPTCPIRFPEVLGCCTRFLTASAATALLEDHRLRRSFHKPLRTSMSFQRVAESSRSFQELLEVSRRFKKVPQDLSRYCCCPSGGDHRGRTCCSWVTGAATATAIASSTATT